MSRTIQNPISKGTLHYSVDVLCTFLDFIFYHELSSFLSNLHSAGLLEPFYLSRKRRLFQPVNDELVKKLDSRPRIMCIVDP